MNTGCFCWTCNLFGLQKQGAIKPCSLASVSLMLSVRKMEPYVHFMKMGLTNTHELQIVLLRRRRSQSCFISEVLDSVRLLFFLEGTPLGRLEAIPTFPAIYKQLLLYCVKFHLYFANSGKKKNTYLSALQFCRISECSMHLWRIYYTNIK